MNEKRVYQEIAQLLAAMAFFSDLNNSVLSAKARLKTYRQQPKVFSKRISCSFVGYNRYL